jgi:alpha-galactosidase/6-phospho-beta-glucosidase family protein
MNRSNERRQYMPDGGIFCRPNSTTINYTGPAGIHSWTADEATTSATWLAICLH